MPWGTGIRGLMRGIATLPQGNQELLVVRDGEREGGREVWREEREMVLQMPAVYFLLRLPTVGRNKGEIFLCCHTLSTCLYTVFLVQK